MMFQDRREAGRLLAKRLKRASLRDPLVLALPRGGVPIAFEIAEELKVPFDVLVVRKIGAPVNPEYGIGAITEGGSHWIDEEAARAAGAGHQDIEKILQSEYEEVGRRIQAYRGARSLPSIRGRSVIVVDDGLATGVTARVACRFIRDQGASQVVLAVPVCSPRTAADLRSEVDEVICLDEPEVFFSVGQFYENFGQTSDEEVISLLSQAHRRDEGVPSAQGENPRDAAIDREILVEGGGVKLPGRLSIPPGARGLVIFAHGSGSSRFSPRNQQVAHTLNEAGLGTLLFDLLTPDESADRRNVFDIPLLASRLALATDWFRAQRYGQDLPIGYFGASTGAGAALWAAADLGKVISAVVSRGGRPDLAIPRLQDVSAPTLLVVGGDDEPVIQMNERALQYLKVGNLVVVPGASHLFEERGTLEAAAGYAVSWFSKYLKRGKTRHEAA